MITILGESIKDVLAKGREEYRTTSANELYSMISNPTEFNRKLDVFREYVPSPDRAIPFPLPRGLAIPLRNSGKLDEIEYWCGMDEEGLVWLASRSKDAKDFVNNFLDSDYNAGVDNLSFFEDIIDAVMNV
jgi:hypothetical protein